MTFSETDLQYMSSDKGVNGQNHYCPASSSDGRTKHNFSENGFRTDGRENENWFECSGANNNILIHR